MKSTRRTRWSEAQARSALSDQERSGQSIHAFCRDRGWQPERLYRWKRRLEATATAKTVEVAANPTSFVRAEVNEARPEASTTRTLLSAVFELVLCNGQRLRFPAEIDPEALTRTVRALEVGPC